MPIDKYVAGLRDYERGNYFLGLGDYARAIAAYRSNAARQFGDWTEACNSLIRFLTWSGDRSTADAIW
ncbi:MAG: hypothetical protein IPK16_28410 [Anaerolineales bacterium]|nr:hypothetical protein [Anaerolineales bacterium]